MESSYEKVAKHSCSSFALISCTSSDGVNPSPPSAGYAWLCCTITCVHGLIVKEWHQLSIPHITQFVIHMDRQQTDAEGTAIELLFYLLFIS